jgi:hypothetical protein
MWVGAKKSGPVTFCHSMLLSTAHLTLQARMQIFKNRILLSLTDIGSQQPTVSHICLHDHITLPHQHFPTTNTCPPSLAQLAQHISQHQPKHRQPFFHSAIRERCSLLPIPDTTRPYHSAPSFGRLEIAKWPNGMPENVECDSPDCPNVGPAGTRV